MSRPGRKCDCSCACGAQPGVDRRDFLKTVGVSAAGAALAAAAGAAEPTDKPYWMRHQLPPEKLAEFKQHVFDLTPPRVYNPKDNPDARFPLSGIGTGGFYLGTDGRMTGWSVTNSMGEFEIGEPFFAVRADAPTGGSVVRVLSTRPPEGTTGVTDIRMKGEYPIVELKYVDKALPVSVSLKAWNPFIPLDSRRSGYPAAVFQFRIKNKSGKKLSVSLLAALPNCVGLANESAAGLRHPNYGGNVNEYVRAGDLRLIRLRAEPGRAAVCTQPVHILIHSLERDFDRAWRSAGKYEKPDNVTVTRANPSGAILKQMDTAPKDAARVVWLENPADVSAEFLKALHIAAKNGATVVFSGDNPLAFRRMSPVVPPVEKKGLPDIVFEDFESGYEKWTVEGKAFGNAPQRGRQPRQQPVTGFLGKGLVNSFTDGDTPVGRLISQPFKIERPLIRFLIGGGSLPKRTCINLLVGDKVVRTATGRDLEQLEWKTWDVRPLMNQTARIEIVDAASGPWGHINIDQIVFTENAAEDDTATALRDLLPATFSDFAYHSEPLTVRLVGALPSVGMNELQLDGWMEYKGLKTASNSETVLKSPAGVPLVLRRRIGNGQVVLVASRLLANIWSGGRRTRALSLLAGLAGVRMTPCEGLPPDSHMFGELALATPVKGGAVLDWTAPAQLVQRLAAKTVAEPAVGLKSDPTPPGMSQGAALEARVELAPRQTADIPILLSWHFPNAVFSRNMQRIGHYYSKMWPDAMAVATDLAANLDKLGELTERFRKTFYNSTLPYWLLDCVSSQISTIRTEGVCFWMEDGTFCGWEGTWCCCQPTCTHVWGYEQTLAHLFPDLERIMRYVDYKRQQTPEGGINNRVEIPIPPTPSGERPFVDGHCSCILKAYRETLKCPNDEWFKEYWPNIKKAVDYLIMRDGKQPDGIIEDEQWHTYDVAAFGPNSFLGSYYLAALRAGEEMALRAGDAQTAERYRKIFEAGRANLVKLTWNGEYFQQNYPDYMTKGRQWGPGCLADQVIGQWWAHQLGLGYVLPKEYVRRALESVFKYNWMSDLTDWQHTQRWFADGNDKGLLCCTWPKGGRPPQQILYSDEVWTGVEYQVAAHMIYEGMLEEAFCIVKGARERYDGRAKTRYDRNPWDEKECGGHYVRAMSSWSLLLALAGFLYDGPRAQMTFAPVFTPEKFKCFFTAAEGWGSLEQTRKGKRQDNQIFVAYARVSLNELILAVPDGAKNVRAKADLSGLPVAGTVEVDGARVTLKFAGTLTIHRGQSLNVRLMWT
ncbi:MAG: non-lysosomal glucosylceramidase [Candidatus Sumerlaeia bacterium]|nr:non-lysosomal glucosylceramidase [Candidatus Sumerlaeia bacterium]